MKQGLSLTQLASELDRQRTAKVDYLAPCDGSRVRMQRDGSLLMQVLDATSTSRDVRPHAHRQIGTQLNIPAKYYDRMLNEAPELLSMNVNHWWIENPERRMLRTLDGELRAYLSDTYRALDNYDLANSVLPKLIASKAEVESCNVTETKLYIKARFPDVAKVEIWPVDVSDAAWGKGHHRVDIVEPGIVISNSEVGAGSLAVAPALYTEACSNLAVSSDMTSRRAHRGKRHDGATDAIEELLSDTTRQLEDAAIWSRVNDLVDAAIGGKAFDKMVEQMRESRGHVIENRDLPGFVEIVGKAHDLRETEQSGILAHLIGGGEFTQYGIANAVTRFSQDVEDYDRASDLERVGADIIELNVKAWGELAKAA